MHWAEWRWLRDQRHLNIVKWWRLTAPVWPWSILQTLTMIRVNPPTSTRTSITPTLTFHPMSGCVCNKLQRWVRTRRPWAKVTANAGRNWHTWSTSRSEVFPPTHLALRSDLTLDPYGNRTWSASIADRHCPIPNSDAVGPRTTSRSWVSTENSIVASCEYKDLLVWRYMNKPMRDDGWWMICQCNSTTSRNLTLVTVPLKVCK